MKFVIPTLIIVFISIQCKAQTESWNTGVKPFTAYYDTVKVWMLVSDAKVGSKPRTIIGYEIYRNYYVEAPERFQHFMSLIEKELNK